jgi:hypothetical protein
MQHYYLPEYLFIVYKVLKMSKLDLSAEFCFKTTQKLYFYRYRAKIKPRIEQNVDKTVKQFM